MEGKPYWRWLHLVMAIAMALMLVPAGPSAAREVDAPGAGQEVLAPQPQATPVPPKQAPPVAPPARAPITRDVMAKLHVDLQELARVSGAVLPAEVGAQAAVSQEAILVNIISVAEGDSVPEGAGAAPLIDQLRTYFVDGQLYGQPAMGKGEQKLQMLFGRILPANLLKVASFPAVKAIYPIEVQRAEFEPYPADDAAERPGPKDWAVLRANADKLREGSLPWDQAKAFGDGRDRIQPTDWFEKMPEGPHKAQAAWDRGYTGEGVAVSVIDDGVDFAHPDLMGTQKIYSGTWSLDPSMSSPYNGWPMIMDPFTMRAYAYDVLLGSSYVGDGFAGVTYFDTSVTPPVSPCGVGVSCFSYTPLIAYGVPGYNHTYVISNTMTKSGIVHVGTHHDESLRDYVWGERVAVLVTDPNVAGVYDTVYVDLDDDYDFRDEKPVTRADSLDPATWNNPVSYRDMNGDGLADLSGGLLYFIADGVNYIPASDWLWGGLIPPPGNGDLIAMHGPWDSGYSHGTNCASNVVANGVIDGMLPEFSDLPGDGVPDAAVYGMAPDADMVAMNNGWYFTGWVNAADAYFLAAIGWDGVDQTGYNWYYGPGYDDTDTIVATSNSYGWSEDFHDGYDYLGQLIVELQRNWAPYLQFLFSTGNGGPGYGTVAPPSPALGIGVGASTEYGSTGWDTITETTQIMFNDMAAFSNSGPGARDGAGVDVVAGGAFAAGAEELNYYSPGMYGVLDGNVSWDDWGGTSRVALGVLALIYQAYKDAHGVWPTHEQAKALLMSSATDINYDVFKQGAGSVNADRGTEVASGEGGVYMGLYGGRLGDVGAGRLSGHRLPGLCAPGQGRRDIHQDVHRGQRQRGGCRGGGQRHLHAADRHHRVWLYGDGGYGRRRERGQLFQGVPVLYPHHRHGGYGSFVVQHRCAV